MDILLNTFQQELRLAKEYTLYTNTKGCVFCQFNFTDEWDGLIKTAYFRPEAADSIPMLLDGESRCKVPDECLAAALHFTITISGGRSTGTKDIVFTSNAVDVTVLDAGASVGDTPDVSDDIYVQLLTSIRDARDGANSAAASANTAAANAANAAAGANEAISSADAAADRAQQAANTAMNAVLNADNAADHANLAAERVEDAVSLADSAMSLANTAAANASNAALDARHAATDILNKAVSGEFDGHGLSVLGLYGTLAELQAAHPSGSPGDAYAVGTAAANDLFVWNAGESSWQNVGNILGGWTMNDLCIDGGDWTSGTGGWMMDSLCMDAGDWSGTGTVDTLSEHEVNPNTHGNLMIDGSIL